MEVTYDEDANAAYISLGEQTLGGPTKTVAVPDIDPWMVNLDFDPAGVLLGIEVLDARQVLPWEFLRDYAKPGGERSS
jgi:uncharacterized protein YuzE